MGERKGKLVTMTFFARPLQNPALHGGPLNDLEQGVWVRDRNLCASE